LRLIMAAAFACLWGQREAVALLRRRPRSARTRRGPSLLANWEAQERSSTILKMPGTTNYASLSLSGSRRWEVREKERACRSLHLEEAACRGVEGFRRFSVRSLHVPPHLHYEMGEAHGPVHAPRSRRARWHERHQAIRSSERCRYPRGHDGRPCSHFIPEYP